MAHFICDFCEKGFKRHRTGERPIRFCSQKCYHEWRIVNNIKTGQFLRGHKTWNKGIKGLHFSPKTEFKKGTKINSVEVGTVRIRKHKKETGKRAWVKTANPNTWRPRSIVEWEKEYGPIPRGLVVHHIDRNTLNDNITNLALMSRARHLQEHRHEIKKK